MFSRYVSHVPGKMTCFLPSASGLYIALRNIFLFWLTKLQMLCVCFLISFCCLSFSELYRNVPNRHEYKWSRINVRKCSLNSKAWGNCERTCHTQSINCKNTGDLKKIKLNINHLCWPILEANHS